MNNNNQYVEFQKTRDLGAIITDTFKFLRLEWKPFFNTVFKISLVPVLFAIAGILYYSFEQSNLFSAVNWENPNGGNTPFTSGGIVLATFVMIISYVVAYIMINVASMYYLKSYVEHDGNVKIEEISNNVKQNIWAFVGLGILVGLMVGIGMLFCLIPGIYLMVPLSLATSIYVFKGKDVMESISYSFTFIKDHWWETFGIILVIGLLISVLGSIFSIPSVIYMFVKAIVGANQKDPSVVMSVFSDPVYILLTVLSYLGKFLFYAVSLVSTVLIYFDINEQKYATGTINKIDRLGQ